MKTYDIYRKFISEYLRFGEPYWQSCRGRLLEHIWDLSPRELKKCIKVQYHKDSAIIKKFPLWFIGDALQGHIPYTLNDEEWDNENYEIFDNFTNEMYKRMKKHKIAPRKWLNWYNGCKRAD